MRLRAGHLSRTTAILGVAPGMGLLRLLDADRRPLALPPAGLSLSRTLGEELGVHAGDEIEIEVLEGDRRKVRVPVAALVEDLLGLTVMQLLLAVFAAAIAIGVVYNNARIALEVRSRDLATMRILGFTRAELSLVLLGEQAIQVVLGIAPGLYLGRAIGKISLLSIDRDLLRIPVSVNPASYIGATCVVFLAALLSSLIVRRQSDRLDLVAVLKARD